MRRAPPKTSLMQPHRNWKNPTVVEAILKLAASGALLTSVAFMLWYIFYGYQSFFHSDSAAKVLLAREIYDTGEFFPKDWNYVNGDLFVVFGHLFIIPLLSFMPAGFTAHAISGAIFSGLLLYGVWLISSLAIIPIWRRITVVAIVASGISGLMAENLYGQVSYGVIAIFCCYLIFSSTKYISTEGRRKLVWGTVITVLLILAYWSNPKRAVVAYGLPLITALVWVIVKSSVNERRQLLELAFLSILAAAIGTVLHAFTISNTNNVQGVSNANWLPFELIFRNFALTFSGIYAQLGGFPLGNTSIFAFEGLYAILRFLIASLLIIFAPFFLNRTITGGSSDLRLFALFTTTSLVLTLFLHFTTTIPDMSDPIQSSRYLVPSLLLCIILILISPTSWSLTPLTTIFIALASATIFFSSYNNYRYSNLGSGQTLTKAGVINPDIEELINFLKTNGLKYGYASYWNAAAISVLSDEAVKIRQIQVRNGLPFPMAHLSSNRWYHPSAWEGRTFILLQDNEVDLVDWVQMKRLGLTPNQTHQVSGFKVFVFDENIARRIPGWDAKFAEPGRFLPGASSLHRIGRIVKTGNGDDVLLIADKGEHGYLFYGPYVWVAEGHYRATFDVLSNANQDSVVKLDVVDAPRGKVYGERTLFHSDKSQSIEFSLEEGRRLEFRVFAFGNEVVKFGGVSIERIPEINGNTSTLHIK